MGRLYLNGEYEMSPCLHTCVCDQRLEVVIKLGNFLSENMELEVLYVTYVSWGERVSFMCVGVLFASLILKTLQVLFSNV